MKTCAIVVSIWCMAAPAHAKMILDGGESFSCDCPNTRESFSEEKSDTTFTTAAQSDKKYDAVTAVISLYLFLGFGVCLALHFSSQRTLWESLLDTVRMLGLLSAAASPIVMVLWDTAMSMAMMGGGLIAMIFPIIMFKNELYATRIKLLD